MRILVTGSRDWNDHALIRKAILKAAGQETDVTIVHGAARGADTLAGHVAYEEGFNVEAYGARWGKYGKAAGPIRNQEMVDKGADIVLAFMLPGSRGTADCVKRAREAGLHVVEYHATL